MEKFDISNVNEQLRKFRKLMNKTQAEFGQELNVTQANISLMERSIIGEDGKVRYRNKPSAHLLEQIANAYPNINFNWLFHNIGEPIIGKSEESKKNFTLEQMQKTLASYKETISFLNSNLEELKEDKEELKQDKEELRRLLSKKSS